MSYLLNWKNQTIDPSGGKAPFTVPVGTLDSTHSSLVLTGKGSANFGKLQQENFLRLLENFADTVEPDHPTIGQLWYDATLEVPKICISVSPVTWKQLGGIQVTTGSTPSTSPALGDLWYEQTGSASGILYVYTGLGRYPTTATTIGGWEQVFPTVQVLAGRDIYDTVRKDLEAVIGSPVGSFGSGAIGGVIQNLTDFGALDKDLRDKFIALGSDPNVLISTALDAEITQQAPSSTLFYGLDSASPSDGNIFGLSGGVPTPGTAGSILIDGVTTAIPATFVSHQKQVDDGFFVWNGTTIIVAKQLSDGWYYDNGTTWVSLTPTSAHYAIGTISTLQDDNNSVYPIDRQAILWAHGVPLLGAKVTHLKVQPNSQDWDALLAAAKYGLSRLELPASFYRQIPDLPFVSDGRVPPASLTSLSESNVRYPSARRRSRQEASVISQIQGFTQLQNALQVGVVNKFSLLGINGTTGTNPAFAPTTTEAVHAGPFSSVVVGGIANPSLRFRFAGMNGRNSFLGSGGAICIQLSHTVGSSLAGDLGFQALLNARGYIRLTADKTRIFGLSLPRTMSVAPIPLGLWNVTGVPFVLTTQTLGLVSYTISATRGGVGSTEDSFDIVVSFNTGSPLSGTTSLQFSVIYDNETYNPGSIDAYSRPLTFTGTDLLVPL